MECKRLSEIEEETWSSPRGRFELFRKSLSLALGGKKDIGEWGGGHPFDVEHCRLPAGKSNFPLHAHSAQTEFYFFLSGSGLVHSETGTLTVSEGDSVHCPPGEAHRIENTGLEDLVYLVIADQPKADVCRYPETGKLFIKPERICLRPTEVDYFEPEE